MAVVAEFVVGSAVAAAGTAAGPWEADKIVEVVDPEEPRSVGKHHALGFLLVAAGTPGQIVVVVVAAAAPDTLLLRCPGQRPVVGPGCFSSLQPR